MQNNYIKAEKVSWEYIDGDHKYPNKGYKLIMESIRNKTWLVLADWFYTSFCKEKEP